MKTGGSAFSSGVYILSDLNQNRKLQQHDERQDNCFKMNLFQNHKVHNPFSSSPSSDPGEDLIQQGGGTPT